MSAIFGFNRVWTEHVYTLGTSAPQVADPYDPRVMRPDWMSVCVADGKIISVDMKGPLIRKRDGADGSWVSLRFVSGGKAEIPSWVAEVLAADGVGLVGE